MTSAKREGANESGRSEEEGDRRVITNAPLSLKQQLRQVERIKGIEKARALKPLPRTKFRQRKQKGEERETDADEKPPAKLHTRIRPKKLDQKQLFIVDGYNVCGCWPELKPLFHSGQIEKCRNLLIEELSFFRDARVLAVFDATSASSSAPSQTAITQWLTIVYVSDADEYIDRELSKYTSDEDLDVCVVTSDNLTRSLAGTGGATLMLSLDFYSYLKELKSKDEAEMKILSLRDGYRGTLRFALNQNTRDRLLDMRRGLRDVSQDQLEENDSEDNPSKVGARDAQSQNNTPGGGLAKTVESNNKDRKLKMKERAKERAKKKKKKKKFKSVDLPSTSPLSHLGQAAESKLLGMRQKLSPPEETKEEMEEESRGESHDDERTCIEKEDEEKLL